MSRFPTGAVVWVVDPTGAHEERPAVVLSHENNPYGAVQCTVMCLGTGGETYDHYAPELDERHLSGITFGRRTYLMPWALYTIVPGSIQKGRPVGELTDEGERLVKKGLLRLFT